jgi:tetratricopeptide (TPR) repeat protein
MATAIVLIEEPNLLQNLRLAERQQDWDNARLMLKALGEVYQRRNRIPEFRTLRQQALEQIGTKFEQTKEAFQFWVYLQSENASDALESADLAKASNIYQKISSELKKLNDPSMNVETADVELCLGMVAQEQQDFEAALTNYKKALNIFESIGDSDKAANVYHQLGSLSDEQGDLNLAITHYEKALETFETKDLYRSARTYNNLGKVAYQKQDFDAARNYWVEAITLFKRVGDLHLAAASYHNLSALALQQQDFDTANTYCKQALKIFEDKQDLLNASDVYQMLGESPFKARWRDLTGKDCPEEWLTAIRIAREYQEE